jgi:putative restriction endonuclease
MTGFPEPLADGLLLAGKAKGIYKPSDLTYALSIRINLGSTYEDGAPVPTPGGGWLLRYHQEGADPADRDRLFTNRGLMQCIADRIPVGVLRELGPAAHRAGTKSSAWPFPCAGQRATSSSKVSIPRRFQ